jgi:carbamoyl-phosphate synthase large subunit
MPRVLQLCEQHRIEALFPVFSGEIDIFAAHAAELAAQGVGTILAPPENVRLANDKRRMYQLVQELGIPIPALVDPNSPDLEFPLFAKPVTATGGTGAMPIADQVDLVYCRTKNPSFIYQRFLKGPEYTVDTLCDRQSEMVVCSPRLRLATKAGQSVKGRTVHHPALVELCGTICKTVGMIGPCNLQFIENGGKLVFIEMNPRYAAGGLSLTVAAGGNIPLLALKLMLGDPVTKPSVRSGITMLRYWEEVMLDEENQVLADSRPVALE